jgi:hypothetical protein
MMTLNVLVIMALRAVVENVLVETVNVKRRTNEQ